MPKKTTDTTPAPTLTLASSAEPAASNAEPFGPLSPSRKTAAEEHVQFAQELVRDQMAKESGLNAEVQQLEQQARDSGTTSLWANAADPRKALRAITDALADKSTMLDRERPVLPAMQGCLAAAQQELEREERNDLMVGATSAFRACQGASQLVSQKRDEALAVCIDSLRGLAEAIRSWDDLSSQVLALGGPAPRGDCTIPLRDLLVFESQGREAPVLNVARTLAALFADLAEAPRREAEARLQAEQMERSRQQEREAAALRGEVGQAEKDAAMARQRASVAAFYGRGAVSNLFSGLPTSPAAATEG